MVILDVFCGRNGQRTVCTSRSLLFTHRVEEKNDHARLRPTMFALLCTSIVLDMLYNIAFIKMAGRHGEFYLAQVGQNVPRAACLSLSGVTKNDFEKYWCYCCATSSITSNKLAGSVFMIGYQIQISVSRHIFCVSMRLLKTPYTYYYLFTCRLFDIVTHPRMLLCYLAMYSVVTSYSLCLLCNSSNQKSWIIPNDSATLCGCGHRKFTLHMDHRNAI